MKISFRVGYLLSASVMLLVSCSENTPRPAAETIPSAVETSTTSATDALTTPLIVEPTTSIPASPGSGPLSYSTPQMIAGVDLDGISATAVADLNGDGHDDMIIAVTSGLDSGPAREPLFLVNDGVGNLVNGTADVIDGPVPKFFNVRDLIVEDFNGDGRPDVFFSNHGKEDPPGDWMSWPCEQNSLLLSQADGRLRDVTATNLPTLADFSHGSTTADVDGDGDVDIFVNNLGCGSNVSSYLLQNDGQGSFTIGAVAEGLLSYDAYPGYGPGWLQFVDADGDKVGDLIYTIFNVVGLLANDGTGEFTVAPDESIPDAAPGRTTQGSRVVDLTGDGLEDVVLLQTPDDFSPGFALQILISRGDGSFTDETALRLPEQHTTAAQGVLHLWTVDIEGDGDIDILNVSWGPDWHLGEDVYAFYVNQGNATFHELPSDQLPPIHPVMTPIDLNGDGKMDYVFVSEGRLTFTLAN